MASKQPNKRNSLQLDQCTTVKVELCNGIKKRVIQEQTEHLSETGQYLGYPRAIKRLITKLIELENGSK